MMSFIEFGCFEALLQLGGTTGHADDCHVCPGLHVFYSNLLLTHNFSHSTAMERGERSLLPENFIKQSWYHFIVNANLELDVKGQG